MIWTVSQITKRKGPGRASIDIGYSWKCNFLRIDISSDQQRSSARSSCFSRSDWQWRRPPHRHLRVQPIVYDKAPIRRRCWVGKAHRMYSGGPEISPWNPSICEGLDWQKMLRFWKRRRKLLTRWGLARCVCRFPCRTQLHRFWPFALQIGCSSPLSGVFQR